MVEVAVVVVTGSASARRFPARGAAVMPEPRLSRHTVNGRGLQVATSGVGPPLLMLPSIVMTHANWSLLRPHLEPYMLLIMPDPLGSGRSDKPDRPEGDTHGAQAELMLRLIDAMQARQA